MISARAHGGYCCGISHFYDFSATRTENVENEITSKLPYFCSGLYEIVLTGSQLRQRPSLATKIQELGFKYVHRFKNPNSRNICYVFHWIKNSASEKTKLPFKILEN